MAYELPRADFIVVCKWIDQCMRDLFGLTVHAKFVIACKLFSGVVYLTCANWLCAMLYIDCEQLS